MFTPCLCKTVNESFSVQKSLILPTLLPVFPNSYMLDTFQKQTKEYAIWQRGAKSDTPFDTSKSNNNAYLHETVWVETTASSRKMNTENFEKIGNSVSSMHYLLVKSSKKGVFIANRKPSYYKRC